MSLSRYQEKRNFEATPEPAAKLEKSAGGDLFCIQRHDATRLHYDFRLEIGGAMASWAVTKGPSLDPEDKRLAVKVEDHPLSYARFEGNIPAGNYGAGSVMLWDIGAWEPIGEMPPEGQLERGDFKFRLQGKKLRGDFVLVRMKPRPAAKASSKEEWLLIKKKDGFASSDWRIEDHAQSVLTGRTQDEIAANKQTQGTDPFPGVIQPMLAGSSKDVPAGKDWIFEVKWDGVRALAYISGGKTTLRSRKGDEITAQYPELRNLAAEIQAKDAVLDGEIVVCDAEGRPRFQLIQPRITGTKGRTAGGAPARFIAFDLLYLDGSDLREKPLTERQETLAAAAKPDSALQVSQNFPGNGAALLAAVRQQGLEGIMAKRAGSRYVSARSDDWRKIKAGHEGKFLICGFTKGERDHFGALVLGEKGGEKGGGEKSQDAGLTYAGNVGTGFDEAALADLAARMQPLRRKDSPFAKPPKLPQAVVWVDPLLVCSIRFHERTDGGKLRAPVFAGLVEAAAPQSEPRQKFTNLKFTNLKFTNLDKVLFPADGITKGELLEYYSDAAEWLVPHLEDRPLSLLRFPDGIAKKGFFQKDVAGKLPPWFRTEEVDSMVVPIGCGKEALLFLTNLGCIDENPWMSRAGSLDHPDFVLIDLDPHHASYGKIVEAALIVRELLEEIGLTGYPKTTGGDGMHIYVPVAPVYSYDQTKGLAELMARLLAARHPNLFTTPRSLAARVKDRVYFDWLQNGRGKTISAPYVVRPKPGAPVATPLEWKEVKTGLDPSHFHIRNAVKRFRAAGDLFAPVLRSPQTLEKPVKTLEKLVR